MTDPRRYELEARRRNTVIRLAAALAADPRTADLSKLYHLDVGFLNHAPPGIQLLLELESYRLADAAGITDAMLSDLLPLVFVDETTELQRDPNLPPMVPGQNINWSYVEAEERARMPRPPRTREQIAIGLGLDPRAAEGRSTSIESTEKR